jgi:hypothetical protein
MKIKIILSLALIVYGVTTTSCERENDSCVEDHMEEGLNQSDAEEKCDEELVETVEVLK